MAFIQNHSLTTEAYGFLPFNAYGELKNDTFRFAAGLQSDVFNPVSPTIISLFKLYGSGNTGSFRGQVRGEYFFEPTDALSVTTQVALGEAVTTVITDNRRLVEDNGWPNVEAGLAMGLGAVREYAGGREQRPVVFGMSGVVGQLRNSRLVTAPADVEPIARSVIDVWGFGADVQASLTNRFGFLGEFYFGSGLGEYNGGITQSFNGVSLQAIRSRGGFGEAYFYFTDKLHLHAGYGIDSPVGRDLSSTQIARNQ